MLNVICRPELHGEPTREQYDEFHAGMSEFGLLRTITRDGRTWRLPNAEYLGVNLQTSLKILSLKITALSIRVTGKGCKLTLVTVPNVDDIFIAGLEEEQTFWSLLGLIGAGQPSISPLAALASGKCTVPVPESLGLAFRDAYKITDDPLFNLKSLL